MYPKDSIILGLPIPLDSVQSTRRSNLSCDVSLHRQNLGALHWSSKDNLSAVTLTGNHLLQLAKRRKQSQEISVNLFVLRFFSRFLSKVK